MSLPGYDAWKTRLPDNYDGPVCAQCGGNIERDWHALRGGLLWYCERCDWQKENVEGQR